MADASLAELLPRLFLSMAVVIGVMWVAARLLKGRRIPGTNGMRLRDPDTKREQIEIVARQGLGRHSSVAIVRTGDKSLVLGITDTQVSVLTELSEKSLDDQTVEVHGTDIDIDARFEAARPNTSSAPEPAWTGLLSQVREATVRR